MLGALDAFAREAMLFAASGLVVGGLDDLIVDILYLAGRHRRGAVPVTALATAGPMPLAVFVPAWDEHGVIADMLAAALSRYAYADYRILVGLYPNDSATIAAARTVADADPRVRLAIGDRPGPTTKADCLNTLWHALAKMRDWQPHAVILHDAEDLVHPDELTVFAALIGDHDVVQLPVIPLIAPGSIVSGTYADEFAQAHASQLPVRTALGAGMPLAGTGCAIATPMLARLAGLRGGDPFDADSLVEDYELGLRIAELGGRATFARITDATGQPVAVRAYFPATLTAAVRQKARWITGIALAGWDRTGWSRAGVDGWWRMRDRRTPLAMLVLAVAYVALAAWLLSAAIHWSSGSHPPAATPLLRAMLLVNMTLLAWRIGARAVLTGRLHGRRQGLGSILRLPVANLIALLAAARAVHRYTAMLRGAPPVWDKTQHRFPTSTA